VNTLHKGEGGGGDDDDNNKLPELGHSSRFRFQCCLADVHLPSDL
jgi:hypothetical protein